MRNRSFFFGVGSYLDLPYALEWRGGRYCYVGGVIGDIWLHRMSLHGDRIRDRLYRRAMDGGTFRYGVERRPSVMGCNYGLLTYDELGGGIVRFDVGSEIEKWSLRDRIWELRLAGHSIREISRLLDVSESLVSESLFTYLDLLRGHGRRTVQDLIEVEHNRLEKLVRIVSELLDHVDPYVRLRALRLHIDLSNELRNLHGLDAPRGYHVRVEHSAFDRAVDHFRSLGEFAVLDAELVGDGDVGNGSGS